MLIRMSVENFKSFEKRTELTMIPSNKIRKLTNHKVFVRSTPLLKSAVIYGANASGKSNLIDVFHFIQISVRHALPIECINMFCKNSKENISRESTFELILSVGKSFYVYGFSAILSKRQIIDEWLYELFQNGKSKQIFLRKQETITSDLMLSTDEQARFSVYAEDLSEKPFVLFLSAMGKGRLSDKSRLVVIRNVFNAIASHLHVMTPNMGITDFQYYYNDKNLARVSELISSFDTGISDVNIRKISIEELQKSLPKEIYVQLMADIKQQLENLSGSRVRLSMRSRTDFFNIDLKKGEEPNITTIKLHHGPSFYDFGFSEESDGTRRLFDLMDMLLNSTDDSVYVVDELERSLHPKLTEHFLKLFSKIHANENVQLIFTTHEDTIMTQSLFRRDEIWFVERSANNNSVLYSLDRFKERYDKKLSKAYLEGRYGAIPIFSSFNFKE